MRPLAVSVLAAAFAAMILPHVAAAQCEGGVTVAGFYARDGTYVPGHCAYTNPTTPGQLYPSGAQPVPSTNPAQGASRLPGQLTASGLLPVNSSDLGPAPSYANSGPLQAGGAAALAPSVGPGTPLNATNASGTMMPTQPLAVGADAGALGVAGATAPTQSLLPGQAAVNSTLGTTVGLPGQFPQTGLPALNGNRALPGSLTTATGSAATAPGVLTGVATTGASLSLVNTAYGLTLGAAPAREEPAAASEPDEAVTVTYPNQ
jgi:hypothetical protein